MSDAVNNPVDTCRWCDKLIDSGDNAETRRRACLGCIEQNPDRFAPLTADEQAWADAPWTVTVASINQILKKVERW